MSAPNTVLVGTWTLNSTSQNPAANALVLGKPIDAAESAFADDARRVVNPRDILPSGKYGAIVKLQIRYEGQAPNDDRYAQGTGWLIKDDILVTAGHCVFDWSHGYRKAIEIKAYTGYNGKASIGQATVQFRQGRRIATTRGWLKSGANRDNDVAFIQVDTPFRGITPFKFAATPAMGTNIQVGVVGYPADQSYQDEKGAQMYEMFSPTSFDLSTSVKHMLEYKISTYAGQSGSPVLLAGQNISIGAHVYGLSEVNAASTIHGTWGNVYSAYISSFDDKSAGTVNSFGTRYLEIASAEDALEPLTGAEEGFWQTLGKVVKIGGAIGSAALQAGSPFLGPAGAPIAAAAGTALSYASKMADSAMKAESTLDVDYGFQSEAARASLAEAALQTVLEMDEDQLHKYNIYGSMQQVYNKEKVHITPIASKIMPAMLDPALRIATYTATKDGTPAAEAAIDYPAIADNTRNAKSLTSNEQQFIDSIQQAATTVHGAGEEGFFDFLGGIVKTGVSIAAPHLGIIGKIAGGLLGAEADLDGAPPSVDPHLETLAQRAVMGEAALQALMQVPAQDLHEEGFFGSLINIVKKIAPTVIQAAPAVIGAVTPVIKSLLATQPESAFGKKQQSKTIKTPKSILKNRPLDRLAPPNPRKQIPLARKKPSLGELLATNQTLKPFSTGFGQAAATATVTNSAPVYNNVPAYNEVLEPQQDGLFFD